MCDMEVCVLMAWGGLHLCGGEQLVKGHWWSAALPRYGCTLILTSQCCVLQQSKGV